MRESKKHKYLGLRAHLVLWLSASLIAVGALLAIPSRHLLSRPIKRQLAQRAQHVADEMVARLAEDVWNMDDTAIRRYFVYYPWESLGLSSVKVTTEFNDALFERTFSIEVEPIRHRAPILRKGTPVGYVEIELSQQQVLSTQDAVGRSVWIITVLSIIVIFLVCSIIIDVVVMRPVRGTVKGLRSIGGGSDHYQLPQASTAEFHSLNEEISAMASGIFNRQRKLEEAIATRQAAEANLKELNEALETRIHERTNQLRRLAKLLASAQEHEQKRIAEGLHDDVAQLLAAGRMKLTIASARAESDACRDVIQQGDALVQQAYDRLRLLSFELASATLYQRGLKHSLVKLCTAVNERYEADCEVIGGDNLDALDDMNASVLFKGARELLFNVIKHAGVKRAQVRIARTDNNVTLTVDDQGKGFDTDIDFGVGSGLGLFSVAERVQGIGGHIEMESTPGILTRISISVPWLTKDAS